MLRMLWVAAYDITADRARRKVERELARQAERIQYSVFEGHLSENERAQLRLAVATRSGRGPADSVRWYGLCARCRSAVSFVGRGARSTDPRFFMP
jgi:CRISPR-associated protein Cas2